LKPFECEVCGKKVKPEEARVRWYFDRAKRTVSGLQVCHSALPCGEGHGLYNRSLELAYVYAMMPEFLAYITRFETDRKKLKSFVQSIEKGRSYIRRHTVDKKEVKKLIILMDGTE
jgi:hypothetical protein